MEYWALYKAGKVLEQVMCEDGGAPVWSIVDRSATEIALERLGDLAAEILDPETGDWLPNEDHPAFLADFNLGKTFIENSHIEKSIEAKLILAGYEFEGLLTREAEMLGIPVAELAQQVRDKAKEEEDKEIERRRIKAKK